jgi:hypothetical protein
MDAIKKSINGSSCSWDKPKRSEEGFLQARKVYSVVGQIGVK